MADGRSQTNNDLKTGKIDSRSADDPRYLPRDPSTENMQRALSQMTGKPVGVARVTNEYGDFVSVNFSGFEPEDVRDLAKKLNDNGKLYEPLGLHVTRTEDYSRLITPANYLEVLQEMSERISREVRTDKPLEFDEGSLKLQPNTPDLKSHKTGRSINEGPKMELPDIPKRPSRLGVFFATLFGGMFGIRAETYAEKMAKRMDAIERFNKAVKEFNEGERKARSLAHAGAQVQVEIAEERQKNNTPNKQEQTRTKEEPARTQEQTRTQEKSVRKQEEPVRKQEEPARKQEEPVRKQEEPVRKQEEPVRKQEEPVRKQEEPTRTQEKPARTQQKNALPKPAAKQQWQPAQREGRPKITQEKLATRRAAIEQQNQKFRQALQKQQANLNRLREKQAATKQTTTKQVTTKQTATKQTATKQTATKQTATKQTATKQTATKQIDNKESRRIARENERLDKKLQSLQKESEKLAQKNERMGKLLSGNTLTQEDELSVDQELDKLMEELKVEENSKSTAVRTQERVTMDFRSLKAEEGVKSERFTPPVKHEPERQLQKDSLSR